MREILDMLEMSDRKLGSAVATFNEEAKRLVKERPGAVLLAALALGYVAGRFLSRR